MSDPQRRSVGPIGCPPRVATHAAPRGLGRFLLANGVPVRMVGAGLPGSPLGACRSPAVRSGERGRFMNPLPLPGLIGTQPLCALAAFGLLRICSSTQLGQVKLGWDLAAAPN